ncbi:hypothetical protein DM860_016310 [Cuscuta australis]|uniref:Pentacotripeptide-repeat region of PRORP domain-containing protein n=1 Tax=Cuscuta australis TaxID=267555 RepID=A0A328E523_9ASTE|nr:hypothetical protein DM860_016310 [Cuscuta australis]
MVIRQCCMLNPVMDKAFIKERFDKAKWLFTEMMSSSSRYKSVTLDNNTFHKLVDSLCEYGFVEDALHLVQLIINEQGEGSKVLDAHTCRCLVGELYGQGNARLAADALKDMVALGYVEEGPTDGVFRVLDGSLVPNSLVHILVKSELEVRHMRERNAAKFGLPASDSRGRRLQILEWFTRKEIQMTRTQIEGDNNLVEAADNLLEQEQTNTDHMMKKQSIGAGKSVMNKFDVGRKGLYPKISLPSLHLDPRCERDRPLLLLLLRTLETDPPYRLLDLRINLMLEERGWFGDEEYFSLLLKAEQTLNRVLIQGDVKQAVSFFYVLSDKGVGLNTIATQYMMSMEIVGVKATFARHIISNATREWNN